jgi:hypothetical protein
MVLLRHGADALVSANLGHFLRARAALLPSQTLHAAALALIALFCAAPACAEPATVCTITVNSADEREAFREFLPASRYRFVELAERGRADWLGTACRQQVQCDVLVVSGHFAGTDFYSSQHGEHLPVDEIERVACSGSCPDLFSKLKEVYLFGCDTLKSDAVRSASPEIVRDLVRAGHAPAQAARMAAALSQRHGESARDRMRRVFPGVPVIYGFSSLAPYGRFAGPMLRRHFENGAFREVGSGEPSQKLLKLFGPASMVATEGMNASEPGADYRAEACRYHDERITAAERLAFVHEILRRDAAEVRMAFARIEKFVASLDEAERSRPEFVATQNAMAADTATQGKYLALVRETEDPALRVRMVSLARSLGWLSETEQRAELARLIGDVLARGSAGFGEVDMICALNSDRALDAELTRFSVARLAGTPANAAALACLGSIDSRARVLDALLSSDEGEVQVAQAYLRHRPLADGAEMRSVVAGIARMKAAAAQARALETLARHHVTDAPTLADLAQLFARSTHLRVQRAIAEVFIRSGPAALETPGLAGIVRRHRLKSPDGADLIDALIGRLAAG